MSDNSSAPTVPSSTSSPIIAPIAPERLYTMQEVHEEIETTVRQAQAIAKEANEDLEKCTYDMGVSYKQLSMHTCTNY